MPLTSGGEVWVNVSEQDLQRWREIRRELEDLLRAAAGLELSDYTMIPGGADPVRRP